MKLLRGPMEGLRYLHEKGYMHRDVTCRNMFVMADGCGVLGDYGKVLMEVATKSNRTGPAHTRAPEVDGTSLYDKSADVWSFAFAIMKIFFKDLYSWVTFNKDGPQSKAWVYEGLLKLKFLGRQSSLHANVARIVQQMLTYEAQNRPTMEVVLARWSALDLTEAATSEHLGNNGPPAKFQKTSENTKAARPAPSPLVHAPPAANLSIVDPSTGVATFQQVQKQNRPAPSPLGCEPPVTNPSMVKSSTEFEIIETGQKQNHQAVNTGRGGNGFAALTAAQRKYLAAPIPKKD